MKKIKLFLLFSVVSVGVQCAPMPSIQFTYVPPMGSYANLTGKVSNVSPSIYGVATFINVFGTWWVKPSWFPSSCITPINADGTFVVNVTTGGTGSVDAYAENIVAYVVPLSYSNAMPQMQGQTIFSAEIVNNSIASVSSNRVIPITFTNYLWQVKETALARWDPGQNYWTGTNVVIDSQGRLHLKIAYVNGQWSCSEVILTNSFGYGTYRIQIDNDLSSLPTNIVFGFFTWNNKPTSIPGYSGNQEFDFEFSNGSVVGAPTNWQNVVQPWSVPANRVRYSQPSGSNATTHTVTWTPGNTYFESYTNRVADQRTFNLQSSSNLVNWATVAQTNVVGDSTNTLTIAGPKQPAQYYRAVSTPFAGPLPPFQTTSFTNGVPPAGGESIHLNLWLNAGGAPGTDTSKVYEVVISKFEFIPLTNIAPKLQIFQVATNQTKVLLKYSGQKITR